MAKNTLVDSYLARFPIAAAILYAGLVFVFIITAWSTASDLFERRAEVSAAADILSQLEQRNRARSRPTVNPEIPAATGSPFLEGPSVTVAGATLLQRVASAVTRVGGNIVSSQVDLQNNQAKAGFVSVIANCEVDQPALQQLLYDIEAGFPFLFVDQLVVQAPTTSTSTPGGKVRLLLGVSGQWQGAK